MKTFKFLACMLSVLVFSSLSSQTFDIKSFDLREYGYYHSFTIGNDYYFKASYSQDLYKVNKNNPEEKTKLSLESDSKEESLDYVCESDGQILMVTHENEDKTKPTASDPSKTTTISFTTRINLYLFDVNGKKIKKVFQKVSVNDSFEVNYRFHSDSKTIFLYQNKNVLKAYDYSLNEKSDNVLPKYKEITGSTNNISDEIQDFMKMLSLQFDLKLDLDYKSASDKDTVHLENYAVSYSRVQKVAGIYKKYYTELTVHSYDGKNYGKEIGVDIGDDKILTEAEFRVLKNGNLLLFGRYKEKSTSDNCMYGIFSCVLNNKLDFVKDVQTNDLVRINSGPGNFEDNPYTGLFLIKLHNPDYTFNYVDAEGKESFIMTSQQHFNNLVDHIYIFRVSEDGEMVVNYIGNRTKNAKGESVSYAAHLVKDRIVFFYYENALNFSNKVNELRCMTTIPGKKTNLLVSTAYKIDNDDFTDKRRVSDIKTLKLIPDLDNSSFEDDDSNAVHTFFCQGKTKKGKIKNMFMITFGE